jgi:hypothetical protein
VPTVKKEPSVRRPARRDEDEEHERSVRAEPPARKTGRRDRDEGPEDYDGRDDAPARPRRKKHAGLGVGAWIGIAAGLLVLVGGIVLAVWAVKSNRKADKGDRTASGPEEKKPPQQPPQENIKPRVPPGWITYTSPAGTYTVALPGEPAVTRTQNVNKDGSTSPIHQATVKEGGSEYAVIVMDFPGKVFTEKEAETVVAAAVQGGIDALTNARTLSNRPFKYDGYPGVEAEVEASDGGKQSRLIMRVFVVRSRMYTLLAVTPKADPDREKPRAFLESFKLK